MLEYISPDGLLKIISFPYDQKYDSYLAEIELYRKNILSVRHSNDLNTIDNYSFESFVIRRQLGFSIAFHKEQIIAFSSMFVSADYYPKKSIRLLNRFYIASSTRSQADSEPHSYRSKNRKPIIGPIMLAQQARVAQDSGYEWAFVSREMNNSRWSKMFCSALNEKSPLHWRVSKNLAALCEGTSPRCWQHVIFARLKRSEPVEEIKFEREMSISLYMETFGPNSKKRN